MKLWIDADATPRDVKDNGSNAAVASVWHSAFA